ncbi:MAG: hypothetical protein D6706_16580 [Chloroflexi bacterium]|nr:MAG: hypothetical protein D6706_16580 [Chloroflexota bacterium]
MSEKTPPLPVYDKQTRKMIARITLNGYNIPSGAAGRGAMRSFHLVAGDLWNYWHYQQPVVLTLPNGKYRLVRVAAIPADEESAGLIEFL